MFHYSSKRPRGVSATGTGDVTNSSQTTGSISNESQRCSYPNCSKPVYSDGRRSGRKFCGVMHCDFFMNNLVERKKARSVVSRKVLPEADGDHCMLPDCHRTTRKDDRGGRFDFCGKSHMLAMVEELTKFWNLEGRLCRLKDCFRHVFVEDDGTYRDYCGMKHAMHAAKQKGAVKMPEIAEMLQPTSFRTVDNFGLFEALNETHDFCKPQEKNLWKTSEDLLIYGERGYHEKLSESELNRLLTDGGYSECCEAVISGVNIYKYHPWELVTKFEGLRPRYFLLSAVTQQDHNGRTQKGRKTKEGFSWKQSGPTHSPDNQVFETRYFKYMLETRSETHSFLGLPHIQVYSDYNKKKDKRGDTEGKNSCKGSRWKMREITLRQSLASEKIIVMIFQEKNGEPLWPPPSGHDLVPASLTWREELNSLSSSDLGTDMIDHSSSTEAFEYPEDLNELLVELFPNSEGLLGWGE